MPLIICKIINFIAWLVYMIIIYLLLLTFILYYPLNIICAAPTLDRNVTLSIKDYEKQWIVLGMSWSKHTFPTQYSVYLRSIRESRMTSTYNNSVTLLLSYNAEYNISLVARNCMGSSVPVSIPFTVGECTGPKLRLV